MGIHDTNLIGVRQKIGAFGKDLSRSYLFAVELPAIFGNAADITTMTLFCSSVDVPDYKIDSRDITFQKIKINVADGASFSKWEVEFLSDESNIIRANLLTWSGVIYDFNRKGTATPRSYKRNIKVHQLDRVGNTICLYTLCGAYPEHVSGYKLENDNHTFVKFSTTFKYDFFTMEVNPLPYVAEPAQAKQDTVIANLV